MYYCAVILTLAVFCGTTTAILPTCNGTDHVFSPEKGVCAISSGTFGCSRPITPETQISNIITYYATSTYHAILASENGCVGPCSFGKNSQETVFLAHRNCTKFCSCQNNNSIVHECPANYHFSKASCGCTYPKEAQCIENDPRILSKPSPPLVNIENDLAGCNGRCPRTDPKFAVHLTHKYCTKFCKCSNGKAVVINCPGYLHFNEKLQVCDHPSNAKCTGIQG